MELLFILIEVSRLNVYVVFSAGLTGLKLNRSKIQVDVYHVFIWNSQLHSDA